LKPLILVTGGNGRFVKILKKENKKLNLKFLDKKDLNILNLNSIEKCFVKFKPKVIFHCAGLSRPMTIHEENISKSIDLNIIGTANMVKVCEKYNVKIIYFSTGYVYEGKKGNYSEKDPVKPFNNYGLSKLGGETSVLMYKNSLILRITMMEKPYPYKKAYTNLISNFIYHEDLVKILPHIITKKGIINIGGKKQSIYDFVKKTKKDIKKNKLNKNTNLPLNQTMNLSLLNKILKK
jgi:dTDP-4-dehydrorhamnose reductase